MFLREGKGLVLTNAGSKLVVVTEGHFEALEEIRADAAKDLAVMSFGAPESVFQWVLLPRLNEIMANTPGLRFEFHTVRSDDAVERVKEGKLNLAVVRSDAVEKPLVATPVGFLDFSWVVPRRLLPGNRAAGVHLLEELPLALHAGDRHLVHAVMAVAAQNHIKISVKVSVDSFGLILQAIQSGNDLTAVLPTPAAKGLSKELFAVVELEGMQGLRSDLSLVYDERVAVIRDALKRVAGRLAKALRES